MSKVKSGVKIERKSELEINLITSKALAERSAIKSILQRASLALLQQIL